MEAQQKDLEGPYIYYREGLTLSQAEYLENNYKPYVASSSSDSGEDPPLVLSHSSNFSSGSGDFKRESIDNTETDDITRPVSPDSRSSNSSVDLYLQSIARNEQIIKNVRLRDSLFSPAGSRPSEIRHSMDEEGLKLRKKFESTVAITLDENASVIQQQQECVTLAVQTGTTLINQIEKFLDKGEISENEKIHRQISKSKSIFEQVQKLSHSLGADLGEPRDWNAEYQKCVEMPADTLEQRLKRWTEIARVAQNFAQTAQMYGKIIISEVFLPLKYRTIKPFMDIGGNAGGEKYIYNGILFKFATDWKKIYDGDQMAMKAASHELLSLVRIQECHVDGVYTPLMTLIDFLGFRLTAVSLLPISNKTIVYGSSDGGVTVHADDEKANHLMDELARRLNLAKHMAGAVAHTAKQLPFPVDIEGHLGKDGRFYLIDMARLMPPTLPEGKLRGCFLYRLLRPEFVRQYKKPLSSDAWSPRFDTFEPQRAEHRADVHMATQSLLNVAIPKLANTLQKHFPEDGQPAELVEWVHSGGVNLRYLSLLRKCIVSAYLRQIIMLEMVARGIKNHFRELLRTAKRSVRAMSMQPYREVIFEASNIVLGNTHEYKEKSVRFWEQLHQKLKVQFPGFPNNEELIEDYKTPTSRAGFALCNHICPTLFVGDKQVAQYSYECYTCGLTDMQGLCFVCARKCHKDKGHHISQKPGFRVHFFCDCSQEMNCSFSSMPRHEHDSILEVQQFMQLPLKYFISKIGFVNLFKRLETLAGLSYSAGSLKELEEDQNYFVFVLPDIEKLHSRTRHMPVVTVAEAQALHLRAKQIDQHQEKMRLFKRCVELLEASIKINPGSEEILNLYAKICADIAFSVDIETNDTMLQKSIKAFKRLKNADKIKELVKELKSSNKKVKESILRSCFDFILSKPSVKNLNFVAEFGDCLEHLKLDTFCFLDDDIFHRLSLKCKRIASLVLPYCGTVTDKGLSYIVDACSSTLRDIVLDGINTISDDAIINITRKCSNLRSLSVMACDSLSNNAFRYIRQLRVLTSLAVSWTAVDAAEWLSNPNLRLLFVRSCKIDNQGVIHIVNNCPLLKSFDIGNCPNIGDVASLLQYFVRNCKGLKLLNMDGLTINVDDRVFFMLKWLQGKKPTLIISGNHTTDRDITRLTECGFTFQEHTCVKDLNFMEISDVHQQPKIDPSVTKPPVQVVVDDSPASLNGFKLTLAQLDILMAGRDANKINEVGGVEAIASALHTDLRTGLGEDEAKVGYNKRIETFGVNRYKEPPPKNFFRLLWEALTELVLLILLAAAIISIVLGVLPFNTEDSSAPPWLEGVAILVVIIVQIFVSAINDFSRDKKFRELNKARTDVKVRVIRAAKEEEINIVDLLVGDVVVLDQGDNIPSDGLFIEGFNLRIDESNMTGESDTIRKNRESDPFLISGSTVAEGSGKMLSVQVGSHSEWGRTMEQLQQEPEETPLQKKLKKMVFLIGWVGLIAAAVNFIALLIYWGVQDVANQPWEWNKLQRVVGIFIEAVTIFVVAVPEGLPLAVTISLAYSMRRMLKDKNLVRHLAACETMGGVTNICSDKTGTLTENRMTVVEGIVGKSHFDQVPPNEMPNKSIYDLLCEGIAVNSKAQINAREDHSFEFIGNKTECALLVFSSNLGYDYRATRESNKALQMNNFSSERKRMSTLIASTKRQRLHVKGASEIVLKRCDTYLDAEGNQIQMTSEVMDYFNEMIDTMADKALRTLALAYREFKEGEYNPEAVDEQEQHLTLIGIVGIEDPLRNHVIQSVADCHKAGIFVRMVTGDNIKTARKIAAQCGILTPDGIAIEGPDFAKLTDEQVDDILPRLQVMARSAPQDKFKLVHRLRMNGEVVAVTGDGTNDALALKEADVGLAMGIAGTAVAKQASDIIILDDNFVSIVKAVIWGRSVYDNIRKFLQFQLTVNLTALVVATIGAVSDSGTPLTAIQLLWVNFIMDTMASLALCTESPTPRLLDRRPYGRQGSLLSPIMIRNILSQSIYQIAILVAALFAGAAIFNVPSGRDVSGPTEHYTFIFNTFVFMQIFNAFNSRRVNDEKNIFSNLQHDWLFLVLLAIIIAIQVIITVFGGVVFTTVNMSWPMWVSSIVLALLSIPLGYLFRLIPVPKERFEREAIADEKIRQEARNKQFKHHDAMVNSNQQQIEAA